MIDYSLSFTDADGRAADAKAGLAADALLRIHLEGRLMFHIFQKGAGPAADNSGRTSQTALIRKSVSCWYHAGDHGQ